MERNKFIFKEVSGNPTEIGKEVGKNFSKEIKRTLESFNFIFTHDFSKSWQWLKEFSKDNFLHVIDERIRQEMEGIVDGYNSVSNTKINFEDILAANGCVSLLFTVE